MRKGQPVEVRVELDELVSCVAEFSARGVLPKDDPHPETAPLQGAHAWDVVTISSDQDGHVSAV